MVRVVEMDGAAERRPSGGERGDRGAVPLVGERFRVVFDREYWPMVRLAAVMLRDRHVAEDVVQQAFVAFERVLSRLDPATEVAYLRKAVVNGCRSHVRRDRARKRTPVLVRDDHIVGPDESVERRERGDHVRTAVDQLPRRQRECLVLRFYAELSEAEIAAALDISTGSVKTHVHRGLATLDSALGALR
jgi:RNA polymerase sigma factor (sigma-70 family)